MLAGSWARGDAFTASDVDLWVIGAEARHRMLLREGRFVSVVYHTALHQRRELRSPARFDGAVPGWRSARILRDPNGTAGRLQREARRFSWRTLRGRRERYVAEQLADWAEEVAKLTRALAEGNRETAAVQRNLLTNAMAPLWLLSHEIAWESENGLWEIAGRRAGPEFRRAQRTALGTNGASFESSCAAALRLYALTARAHRGSLRGEPRRVVVAACRLAGWPMDG